MYLSTIFSAVPHIKSGALKAMAISGDTRAQALPQVPTFTEAGVPGIGSLGLWYGIVAPAGTPRVIIDKISTEIGKYSVMPDFKEKLASLGFAPYYLTPEQFAATMKADMAKNSKIIKAANIKFEN